MSRILIVDDDPSTRFVLRLILERVGHEIIEAGDGVKALEILDSDPLPDIVTADLMMPVMNGFELVHRLRSQARTLSVPIVVVTSNPEAALSLVSEGLVNGVVSKPFSAASFVERIEELAGNQGGSASRKAR